MVATELMMESTWGLQMVVLMYRLPIELDLRSSRCSVPSALSRLGAEVPRALFCLPMASPYLSITESAPSYAWSAPVRDAI